jgi:hypothetical protein
MGKSNQLANTAHTVIEQSMRGKTMTTGSKTKLAVTLQRKHRGGHSPGFLRKRTLHQTQALRQQGDIR